MSMLLQRIPNVGFFVLLHCMEKSKVRLARLNNAPETTSSPMIVAVCILLPTASFIRMVRAIDNIDVCVPCTSCTCQQKMPSLLQCELCREVTREKKKNIPTERPTRLTGSARALAHSACQSSSILCSPPQNSHDHE